ncbi:class I SAM-dependent methyltransferase [Metabacillus sp. cB07]|uniref:class I SAM-dependent methyltransferase n=1 Tax=Metabacillus sp. cB07 TaxID=2806989 RepID=UPI00193A14C9|nr:class I SAM-dependent methyltransferase [Metabacillus sp. cB07]
MMPTYLDLLAQLGVGGAHPGGFMLTKEIIEAEKIPETAAVLDAGCGTGQTMQFLKSMITDVKGIDPDPVMLQKAAKRLKDSSCLIKGSLEKLPFESRAFDYVFCESVLSFTDAETSIEEAYRVLKDEGILLAIEIVKSENAEKLMAEEIETFYGFKSMLNEVQWMNHFKSAGFTDISVHSQQDFLIEEDEPTTEFDMSEDIPSLYFDMLAKHESLREIFHRAVQFRIFRCVK